MACRVATNDDGRRGRHPLKGSPVRLRSSELLRLVLSVRGVTQSELARQARKADGEAPTPGFVSHLIHGRKESADPALAVSICAVLRVGVDLLWIADPGELEGTPCPMCGRPLPHEGDTSARTE